MKIRAMKIRYFLSATAALALVACGPGDDTFQDPAQDPAAAPPTVDDPFATGAGVTDDLGDPNTPQGFVDMAAASDMFEIEAGRLAQERGQSAEIREFGEMMVNDHGNSTEQLRAAAGQVEGVTVSPRMTSAQQRNITELQNAGEDGFDGVYKRQQITAHEQTLNMLRSYAESGEAEPLRSFASETAPVVEAHLQRARDLP